MVPADSTTVGWLSPDARSDGLIERGLQVLLCFTLAAFGSVQPWAVAVMEVLSFLLLGTWVLSMIRTGRVEISMTPVILLWAAVCGLIALQLVPLPFAAVRFLSPAAANVLLDAGVGGPGSWHPLSVHPRATQEDLFKVLAYFSVFLVIVHTYRTPRQVKRMVATILSLGVVLVVFAVLQKGTWNGKLYWLFPVPGGIESNLNYIWGAFINRNHFAGYLEMTAPLGMGMLLYRMSQERSGRRQPSQQALRFLSSSELPKLLLIGTAVFISTGGIFLCISRGGIMGITAASAVFLLMTKSRRAIRKRAHLVIIIGTALMFFVTAAAWERISDRFGELADTNRIMRAQMWPDALALAAEYPVAGSGAGTFNDIFPRYQRHYSTFRFEHAENDYLEIAVELGGTGIVCVLALATCYFGSVVRRWRERKNLFVTSVAAGGISSIVALMVHGMTDFNLRIPANAMLLTIIAALTYATVHTVSSKEVADRA